jgi:tetratricopeptide (TPR) repeat protein
MLPLTREYVNAERSKKPKKEEKLLRRWIGYFKKLTRECGHGYWRWYNYGSLVAEGENIVAAMEWAYKSNKPQVALDLMPSIYWYLDTVGRWNEMLKYGKQALDLANLVGDRLSTVGLLSLLGWTLGQMGEYEEAKKFLKRGLSTCREINGHERYEAETILLIDLAQIARKRGDYAKARGLYERSRQIIKSHSLSDQHQANLDYELGKLARDQGKWHLAQNHYLKVENWASRKKEKKEPFDLALARGAQGNRALALYHLGKYEEARRLVIDSIEFFKHHGGKGYLALLKYRYALIEEALEL